MSSRSSTWSRLTWRSRARREPSAEQQVLPHREMGEETSLLEDVADAPAVFRNEQPAFGIHQRRVVQDDPAAVGANHAGDDVDQRGLARAGAAEECREPALGDEARLQQERPEPVRNIDRETHYADILSSTRRAMNSEMRSAPMEMTIETSVSRKAPLSPPGIWVSV